MVRFGFNKEWFEIATNTNYLIKKFKFRGWDFGLTGGMLVWYTC